MTNKYAEALGVWEHKLGEVEHKLKPKMGDNYKLSKILNAGRKEKDISGMLEKLGEFYYDMVCLNYTEMSEEEKTDLKLWVEMNAMQIMKDIMIAFKWTTKEDMDKLEDGDAVKKLIDVA